MILCIYQRGVLLFSLATAPRVFTKLLAPIAARLHLRNMSMYPHIDIFNAQISRDWIILTQDASVCPYLQLRFTVNLAKSSLIPSQVMTHLGAGIDTLNGLVKPSLDTNYRWGTVLDGNCCSGRWTPQESRYMYHT